MNNPYSPFVRLGKLVVFPILFALSAQCAFAQTPVTEKNDLVPLMSGVATFLSSLQDRDGAIIDPFIQREHQYTTAYFAAGVACLVDSGNASEELLKCGQLAMDKATADFAKGHVGIPDGHGEFYIAPLTLALEWFEGHVEERRWQAWRERLRVPLTEVIESLSKKTNNWRTYAMKGEWLRAQAGLVERQGAVEFIEDAWLNRTQRERIVLDNMNLYQDWNGDPQSHAVEAVGRGNLLSLIAYGYDGPSSAEIREVVETGTATALYLQDPTGQCPPNGRTDNHVFNDIVYALAFDIMAERCWARGNRLQAGRYRRAAQLGYGSIRRWQRHTGTWTGSFYVTKNAFEPADRIGYQPASQYTNYNATILFHLAEASHAWQSDIPARPTPAESMSYAIEMDEAFGSVIVAAGGTQILINLRGDSVPKYGKYWTPLGLVRLAKTDWDGRLGPSDGAFDGARGTGATFCPTWKELGRWVTLAEKAEHYRGTFTQRESSRADQIQCSVLYAPVTGIGGPSFYMDLVVSKDGVRLSLRSPNEPTFGLLVPSIKSDGQQSFATTRTTNTIRSQISEQYDSRYLYVLSDEARFEDVASVQSTVGWLSTTRITTGQRTLDVFLYPRRSGDPDRPGILAALGTH